MSTDALKIISDAMESLGLNYNFIEYQVEAGEEVPLMYWVGEYQETVPLYENGLQEASFLLTGFTRGTWLALEEAKEAIYNYFNRISGKTVIVEDGSAVAIFYANSLVVPTGDAELKRIQINLDIKEWRVN